MSLPLSFNLCLTIQINAKHFHQLQVENLTDTFYNTNTQYYLYKNDLQVEQHFISTKRHKISHSYLQFKMNNCIL